MGKESNDSGDPQAAIIPLRSNISHPDVIDDKGKRVDKRKDKHGPRNPVMPDDEVLVRCADQASDGVCLGAKDSVFRLLAPVLK